MGNVCAFQFGCEALLSRCLDCIDKRSAYIKNLEDNLAALRTELQVLIAARNDVMTRVTIAEQRRMERTDQVQVWLSIVLAVEAKVALIQRVESQEIGKLCFGGYGSRNCKSSYQFGKRVANTLQEVKDLKDKGDFQEVAKAIPEDPADELPMNPKILGQQLIFNEVWSCLKQSQVGIVGLYGTGGVGKTTLLKQVNNSFCGNEGHPFDVVIWTVVSKDLKIMKVQDDIAKKICLCGESWGTKSREKKARDIFKILSKKKFLLLLDDIWERVDLIELGVPPDPKMVSKVVFTTRSFAVCRQMEADREFEVKCLQHEEAWDLFQKKVGRDILNSHPEIPELAETVVQECRGLPLALNTVGRAMACKKTLEEWKDAVEVLRTSAFEFPDMKQLRKLYIQYCDFQVVKIDCAALSQFHAFHSLHVVEVSSCHELKDVTWITLAPCLKKIMLSYCDGMEEIINVEKFVEIQEKWRNLIPFSVLESLELREVPQLKSIYPNPLPFLYLKKIVVYGCPMLKKFPLIYNRANKSKIVIEGDLAVDEDHNDRDDNEHQGKSE
ncbi:Disease resistance protein [Melia azedarach]|uniref:Disease resistance protein n=1 Tax=Melia azedarach TaxID=155640 RepID=A0ACC1Y585_MELAZ|nr:Disease resistance protein [Melia azedarach]